MKKIKGVAAASGIAIAKAYKMTPPDFTLEHSKATNEELEIDRMEKAIQLSIKELEKIKAYTTVGK